MTGTGLYSDILLPAATWYEKHDLSSTDMHPFVHAFTPAINPPWETKSDHDIFHALGRKVSDLAAGHLDEREDLVMVPLLHDTPDAMSVPHGIVKDWRAGEVEAVPGVTMPKFVVVKRDYTTIGAKMSALGPLVEKLGTLTKGVNVRPGPEVEALARTNGVIAEGIAAGRPSLVTDIHVCETILALSGTTNGRVAVEGFRQLEERTGRAAGRPRAGQRGKADHLPRHPGTPGPRHHQPRVVGFRARRPPLHRVRHQRGPAQAVAHPDRPDALLPRPRLDDRARRTAADLPAAAEHAPNLR